MKANEVSNLNSWDQKYATLLQKLDDLQEEKDHPKKQVVDVELDELYALTQPMSCFLRVCVSCSC